MHLTKNPFAGRPPHLCGVALEKLRENAKGLENLSAAQGDATNLGAFPDDAFDAVLALGPMYHLYAPEDWNRALDEAIRVTKPGGLIFTAFLSVYAILYANYLSGNFREGLAENFDGDFRVRHFEEQGFTGFDISEFEALFDGKPVREIALAGTDSVLELAKRTGSPCRTRNLKRLCAITCTPAKSASFWAAIRTFCISAGNRTGGQTDEGPKFE